MSTYFCVQKEGWEYLSVNNGKPQVINLSYAKEEVVNKKMTIDQFAEFSATIMRALPRDLSVGIAQGWIINQDILAGVLRTALVYPQQTAALASTLLWFFKTVTCKPLSNMDQPIVGKQIELSTFSCGLCSGFGDNFTMWFSDKVEQPIVGMINLRACRLLRPSSDDQIIAELGGESKAETTLMEMFAVIAAHSHEQGHNFLTSDSSNIFYIRDTNGLPRAVHVIWSDGGWYVYAHPVGYPRGRRAGHHVFSRNS